MRSANNIDELNKQIKELEANYEIVLDANKQYETFVTVIENNNNPEKERL